MTHPTVTVPTLPCQDLEETVIFWQAMGFEVTYRQRAPNPYAVLRHVDYELHFFGLERLEPAANFSSCLVIVPEVGALHGEFARRLRSLLGRLPTGGFPRLSRMRPGQTRFTLTDNAGNSVIFIRRGPEDAEAADAYRQPGLTPLQRALHAAARLRDFKGDDAAAARVLDLALERETGREPPELAEVLAARLELALALDEPEEARALTRRLQALDPAGNG